MYIQIYTITKIIFKENKTMQSFEISNQYKDVFLFETIQ